MHKGEQFLTFLLTRGCMSTWANNFYQFERKDSYLLFLLETIPYNFVTGAFNWSKTPEGDEFWSTINESWKKKLKEENDNS